MAKIKATSVAFSGTNMYITDQDGKLWVKYMSSDGSHETGEWQIIELPENPASTNQKRIAF
jgi:hypothetical protein